jgi:hypothetical protein
MDTQKSNLSKRILRALGAGTAFAVFYFYLRGPTVGWFVDQFYDKNPMVFAIVSFGTLLVLTQGLGFCWIKNSKKYKGRFTYVKFGLISILVFITAVGLIVFGAQQRLL